MSQVSQGTQSNSSQSEELASTADELGGLADRLREEVARFQLRSSQTTGGVTGQTMKSVVEASHKQPAQSGKAKSGDGNGKLAPASIDRDERGYAGF